MAESGSSLKAGEGRREREYCTSPQAQPVEGEPKNFQILQRSLPAENLPVLELQNALLKKKQ